MFGRNLRRRARWALRRWRLQNEDDRYANVFAEKMLSIPSRQTIQETIREKFPTLRPALSGELNTIAVYRNYNWENSSLREALSSFGTVRHYDWNVAFEPAPKRFSSAYRRRMNKHLLFTLRNWIAQDRPHFIFFYGSGESLHPQALAHLRASGIPLVNVSFNDREHFVGKVRGGLAMGARDICQHFDIWWTSTESALPKLVAEGACPVYLPEAANPALHRPFPDESYRYDVSFVGARYGIREETIRWLADQGVTVQVWGSGWPAGALSGEEMVRTYSRSRINLGFATVAAHDDIFCLKGRDFEVPMSGGLYLTQHHAELSRFFEVGQEVVTWRNRNELLRSIRRLLAAPGEAESIRKAARKRSLAEHSWTHRFETLFELLGLLDNR
jgi:spore maturation protein CgeB